MLAKLKKDLETLKNKCRFIKAVIEERVIIKRKKKLDITKDLKRQNYTTMTELNQIQMDDSKVELDKDDTESEEENDQ